MPKGQPAIVSPWSVEYLPNPVIFSTATVLCAGYNAVRVALGTYGAANDGKREDEERLDENIDMDEKCAECGVAFATKGLLR